jgi:hypothetical protein
MNINDIEAEAKAQIEAEERQAKIAASKVRIMEARGRSWWRRIFPWRIKIERA